MAGGDAAHEIKPAPLTVPLAVSDVNDAAAGAVPPIEGGDAAHALKPDPVTALVALNVVNVPAAGTDPPIVTPLTVPPVNATAAGFGIVASMASARAVSAARAVCCAAAFAVAAMAAIVIGPDAPTGMAVIADMSPPDAFIGV
jgi:hypothetical protein